MTRIAPGLEPVTMTIIKRLAEEVKEVVDFFTVMDLDGLIVPISRAKRSAIFPFRRLADLVDRIPIGDSSGGSCTSQKR